jgi:hypothetical protein
MDKVSQNPRFRENREGNPTGGENFPVTIRNPASFFSDYWEISPLSDFLSNTLGNLPYFWDSVNMGNLAFVREKFNIYSGKSYPWDKFEEFCLYLNKFDLYLEGENLSFSLGF